MIRSSSQKTDQTAPIKLYLHYGKSCTKLGFFPAKYFLFRSLKPTSLAQFSPQCKRAFIQDRQQVTKILVTASRMTEIQSSELGFKMTKFQSLIVSDRILRFWISVSWDLVTRDFVAAPNSHLARNSFLQFSNSNFQVGFDKNGFISFGIRSKS
jgi:hypothetical protein